MPNDPHPPWPGHGQQPPVPPNQPPPYLDRYGRPVNPPPQYGYGPPQAPPVPPKGFGLAVIALVLSIAAVVVPFLPNLPADITDYRRYLVFAFAPFGLVLGVLGCVGPRRGKPLAIIAITLSVLAMAVWTVA